MRATEAWIWREWVDVEPGGEAVDLEDLLGEPIGYNSRAKPII